VKIDNTYVTIDNEYGGKEQQDRNGRQEIKAILITILISAKEINSSSEACLQTATDARQAQNKYRSRSPAAVIMYLLGESADVDAACEQLPDG
jgi:hypothetical protein